MKKSKSRYDVLIIGGGVSGLSAAVEFVSRGKKVLVCEKSQRLGGRASSFVDKSTGSLVDNGQHILMGCYKATRRFLKVIGSDSLATLQPKLKIDYLRPGYPSASFVCPKLFAPAHAGVGLLGFSIIPFLERLQMLRIAKELLAKQNPPELDKITAEQWLSSLHQSSLSKKYLWDVVCIGALNNSPKNVSALLFYRVLREIFLGSRKNSSILLPNVSLESLLVEPAIQFIRNHGSEVLSNTSVENLEYSDNEIVYANISNGKRIFADSFISAVPWYAVNSFFAGQRILQISGFKSAPIISIQLWLDRSIFEKEFAALIDTRIQWVFNVSRLIGSNGIERKGGQHLSCVISGAEEFLSMQKEQLAKIAIEDLESVIPEISNAIVLKSLVLKEKRATFIPEPGLDSVRPGAGTQFKNFFLAGDWTNTGFPSTIEGAILSGQKAAELVYNKV